MVRHTFTFIALLLALVYAVSALPAPRRETGCAPPQLQSLSPGGRPVCAFPPSITAPTEQKLERRAGPSSRKARANARVAKGMPKATAAEKAAGRTRPLLPMNAKKAQKVAERKENRSMGKQQQRAAKIAEWKQKQKAPAYGLDANGKLRKPQEQDFHKKAWQNKQNAATAKATRKAAYEALSPADKAKHNAQSAANSAAKRQKDVDNNVKGVNRQKRITTKATKNAARKAADKKAITTAKSAYANAEGKPTRGQSYTSPQGKSYNGKDVRQAMFASELAQAKGGVGYNQFTGKTAKQVDKAPKNFENRPNSDGSIPLRGASPTPASPLKEFPILHNKQMGYDGRKPNPSEARIITQKNAAGNTVLMGRVGHPKGSDDHVAF